jgi:hypothetical protein
MTVDDKEGTLQMQPGGRWAICRAGRMPHEITSGDVFRVEVDGKLKVTRMVFAHAQSGGGEYCSVDGYVLRSGMRAAIGAPPWGEIVFEIIFGMNLFLLLWAMLRRLWKLVSR